VRISQAPFANNSIVFPSSITQSPAISISQPAASVSGNTAISPVARPRTVIAQVLPVPSTSGCQALPTQRPQGAPTHTAISSLLSQMLSAQLPTNVINPNYLFWVMLVSGNISRCQGCSGKILRASNGKPSLHQMILFFSTRNRCYSRIQIQVFFNCPMTCAMFTIMPNYRVSRRSILHSKLVHIFVLGVTPFPS